MNLAFRITRGCRGNSGTSFRVERVKGTKLDSRPLVAFMNITCAQEDTPCHLSVGVSSGHEWTRVGAVWGEGRRGKGSWRSALPVCRSYVCRHESKVPSASGPHPAAALATLVLGVHLAQAALRVDLDIGRGSAKQAKVTKQQCVGGPCGEHQPRVCAGSKARPCTLSGILPFAVELARSFVGAKVPPWSAVERGEGAGHLPHQHRAEPAVPACRWSACGQHVVSTSASRPAQGSASRTRRRSRSAPHQGRPIDHAVC